jgi:hypothetical protein
LKKAEAAIRRAEKERARKKAAEEATKVCFKKTQFKACLFGCKSTSKVLLNSIN